MSDVEASVIENLRNIGGQGFVDEMISIFQESARTRVLTVREALATADQPTAERMLHGLKSSAANLGALPLSALAGRLEQEAAAHRLGVVSAALNDLDARVEATLTALAPFKQSPAS